MVPGPGPRRTSLTGEDPRTDGRATAWRRREPRVSCGPPPGPGRPRHGPASRRGRSRRPAGRRRPARPARTRRPSPPGRRAGGRQEHAAQRRDAQREREHVGGVEHAAGLVGVGGRNERDRAGHDLAVAGAEPRAGQRQQRQRLRVVPGAVAGGQAEARVAGGGDDHAERRQAPGRPVGSAGTTRLSHREAQRVGGERQPGAQRAVTEPLLQVQGEGEQEAAVGHHHRDGREHARPGTARGAAGRGRRRGSGRGAGAPAAERRSARRPRGTPRSTTPSRPGGRT